MKEVKLYGVVLMALMVLAYLSWTKKDDAKEATKVTLLDGAPENIERVDFFTKTSTVKMTFRDSGGDKVAWFEVTNSRHTRVFAGSKKVDKLLEGFAPFEALRSLGKGLSKDEIALTGLDKPERKLVVTARGKAKTFDVGKRTSGARDHYVRPKSSEEVFLVASAVLSDLQFPEGKYMQRALREAKRTEVDKVTISAGERTVTALQKNRLSTRDAFWATESAPDDKNETLGNYLDKLEKLTAVEYLEDAKAFDTATPVLEAVWYAEGGDELGRVSLRRTGEGKAANFYATSTATKFPVKVSRFTAEQLERDAATALPAP